VNASTRSAASTRSGVEAPVERPLRPVDFRWTIVPHTHWDREWYQPYELFRLRLVRMVDELLDLLEREPEFSAFNLDGQAVILEDYLEIRPEAEPRLRALLEAGRLATGPSYVLPDEFLAPQEALVRNLLIGSRVARSLGAHPTRIGYQPDPFGHVAQLPQVLRGFGLDTFLFWRGVGEEGERLGSLFAWRAPDGSGVVAIRQLGGYGNASQLGRWGRDGRDHLARPEEWEDVAIDRLQRYLDTWGGEVTRDGIGQLLLCNGSDHEPAWMPLPGLVAAIRRAYPGIDVRIGTYDDYVAALDPQLDELPVVSGELRSGRDAHILRGIDSVRMPLKQANERASLALLACESVAALAQLRSHTHPAPPPPPGARGRQDPKPGLDRAWKALLRNQPHDSISGCSVDPVHHEMEGRFEVVEAVARRIGREAVAALGGGTLTWDPVPAVEERAADRTIVNPLPFERSVVVEVPLDRGLARGRRALVAEVGRNGEIAAAQRHGDVALVAVPLSGFEARSVRVRLANASEAIGLHDAGHDDAARRLPGPEPAIGNGRLVVRATADGTFTIEDRATGRILTGVGRLEDVADRGDEYTFCPIDDEPAGALHVRRVERRVVADGPVVAELEIRLDAALPARLSADRRRRLGSARLPVRVVARVVAGGSRVEVRTTVTNRARDHRLRVVVPAPDGVPAEIRAEGHFAVIRRAARPIAPSHPERWAELPQPMSHTTGFVAAGTTAVIGHGLPEYEATARPDGGVDLAVTLLRCVGWLSRDDLSTRPNGAGPAVETPAAQALGRHAFRYDIRLDADAGDAALVRASADARWPVVAGDAVPDLAPALRVAGDVAFAALKPAEEGRGVILRLYNPGRERTPVSIRADGADPWRVRLDETPAPDPAIPETLGPGEILTVRLEPRSAGARR
jgi:mannosylglycerate hydrolase